VSTHPVNEHRLDVRKASHFAFASTEAVTLSVQWPLRPVKGGVKWVFSGFSLSVLLPAG
jgi:hypothetical protein